MSTPTHARGPSVSLSLSPRIPRPPVRHLREGSLSAPGWRVACVGVSLIGWHSAHAGGGASANPRTRKVCPLAAGAKLGDFLCLQSRVCHRSFFLASRKRIRECETTAQASTFLVKENLPIPSQSTSCCPCHPPPSPCRGIALLLSALCKSPPSFC